MFNIREAEYFGPRTRGAQLENITEWRFSGVHWTYKYHNLNDHTQKYKQTTPNG